MHEVILQAGVKGMIMSERSELIPCNQYYNIIMLSKASRLYRTYRL